MSGGAGVGTGLCRHHPGRLRQPVLRRRPEAQGVLTLCGRSALPGRRASPARRANPRTATIALIRDYAAELTAVGGRLYLAGVGPEMEVQLDRAGLLELLGPDAVVRATDELYTSCELAQRRGRAWLQAH